MDGLCLHCSFMSAVLAYGRSKLGKQGRQQTRHSLARRQRRPSRGSLARSLSVTETIMVVSETAP